MSELVSGGNSRIRFIPIALACCPAGRMQRAGPGEGTSQGLCPGPLDPKVDQAGNLSAAWFSSYLSETRTRHAIGVPMRPIVDRANS
jgi:hypothetical protein